ncbi:MAG TPA: polysaccharide deacetylase family protein [Pseudonocardiaceae bacterium]|jgi:peptidoglycan/xylan/chitin deacetylase (PgdA/CDA1 family)|nr:polysaccharide deacetylase family protein [Pseudonocardiaceae bacterium]
MLTVGLAATIAGCGSSDNQNANPNPSLANTAPNTSQNAGGPPPPLPPIPAPHPGPTQKIDHGISGSNKICLTVDDGYCGDCVKGYVDFVQQSGIHLTFSPNGTYGHCWAPHADVLKPLIERQQIQIMNHTYSHLDLNKMTDAQITTELERNDEWVTRNFGITTRPYYRPPYGFHNAHVDGVAASLGYTRTVLWNGSYSDSEVITPQFLMQEAQQYLKPGVIMLGHANHSTVLGLFPQILDLIKQRRLTPVTLDEMFGTSRATG